MQSFNRIVFFVSVLSTIGSTAAMSSAQNQEQQYNAGRYLLRGNIYDTKNPMFQQTQAIMQHNFMWMPSNAEYKQVVGPSMITTPFIFKNLQPYTGREAATTTTPLTQTWSGAPIVVDYVDHDYIGDDDDEEQPIQQQQNQLNRYRALQNFYDTFVQRDHKMLPQQASRNYLPLLPPPFLMHPPPQTNPTITTTEPTYARPLRPLDVQQREAERYAAYSSLFERYVRMYPQRLLPKYDIS